MPRLLPLPPSPAAAVSAFLVSFSTPLRAFAPVLGVAFAATLSLSSCSYPGGDYQGYQMRSYSVRGGTYHPMSVDEALHYEETGTASWYNESSFFGLKRGQTSLGEKVMPWHLIAAHKTLPLPCVVQVTNVANGKSVKCRVNDRGPFIGNRIIDLSPRAAKKIGFRDQGLATVNVKVLSVGDGDYKRTAKRKWFFGLF